MKDAVTRGENLSKTWQYELFDINRTSFYYEEKQPIEKEKEREDHMKQWIQSQI